MLVSPLRMFKLDHFVYIIPKLSKRNLGQGIGFVDAQCSVSPNKLRNDVHGISSLNDRWLP